MKHGTDKDVVNFEQFVSSLRKYTNVQLLYFNIIVFFAV